MTLSARSEATTRRTYTRPMDDDGTKFETWGEVIQRSHIEHHRKLWEDAGGASDGFKITDELVELRDLGLSREGLVAGRTLWLGGTEYAYSRSASQFNCSGLEQSTVYDVVDAFWLLLNGCGVGGLMRPGTLHGYTRRIGDVKIVYGDNDKNHKGDKHNREFYSTNTEGVREWRIVFGDSAEAWAKGLGKLVIGPRQPVDRLVLDGSNCRGPGGRLKGYGWICNGYKPLADALLVVHRILNDNAGGLLDEEDMLDVFNVCGQVLSSRRAAEIGMMDAHNPLADRFATRKHEYWLHAPHRRQSNNTLLFWNKPSVSDLTDLLTMNLAGGEPGFLNATAALRKAPWFRTCNPCLTGDTLVAVADGRNAVRIDQLAEESGGVRTFDVYSAKPSSPNRHGRWWKTEISSAVAIMTGVKRVGLLTLSNGEALRLTPDHKVALADGTYKPAAECVGLEVESFFTKAHRVTRRLINSESDGHAKQHRMLWERANGPKPAGYDIDHIANDGGDYLDNLQLLTVEEHRVKSGEEKKGENNPAHRIKDMQAYRRRKAVQSFGSNNSRFSGLTNENLIELAEILHRDGLPITLRNMRALDERVPSSLSKYRFDGSIETLREIARGEREYVPPRSPQEVPEREEEGKRREVVTVVSFELLGEEPVYDLVVEKNRNFYVITSGDEDNNYLNCKGVLVHNCAEILLHSHSFCNLVSVCLPLFGKDFGRMKRAVWIMARANYRQTCVNLLDGVLQPRWHQTNESLRLCGVSLTGITQVPWLTDYQIRQLRNEAVAGAYSMADELGLPRPKAVTTVKPEGTRSKISGHVHREIAEGMHLPLGQNIFNWINFSVNDPLLVALKQAGYQTMMNPQDRNNELVKFPVRYADAGFQTVNGVKVNAESGVDQLNRYHRWNTLWADHNVSATISIDETDVLPCAKWISEHWDEGYIATSFLRRTDPTLTPEQIGHPYLPQEVVHAGQLDDYERTLKPVDWDRFHHGIHEIGDASDCATGVCPVK